jgi:hypothetical protein
MADTVTTKVISAGPKYATVRLTCVSDGTGESAVTKINLANYILGDGSVPTRCALVEAQWSVQGFSSVRLAWATTTPTTIDVFAAGNGFRDYSLDGVLTAPDPVAAGGSDNVTLTSVGASATATYDFMLRFILS